MNTINVERKQCKEWRAQAAAAQAQQPGPACCHPPNSVTCLAPLTLAANQGSQVNKQRSFRDEGVAVGDWEVVDPGWRQPVLSWHQCNCLPLRC